MRLRCGNCNLGFANHAEREGHFEMTNHGLFHQEPVLLRWPITEKTVQCPICEMNCARLIGLTRHFTKHPKYLLMVEHYCTLCKLNIPEEEVENHLADHQIPTSQSAPNCNTAEPDPSQPPPTAMPMNLNLTNHPLPLMTVMSPPIHAQMLSQTSPDVPVAQTSPPPRPVAADFFNNTPTGTIILNELHRALDPVLQDSQSSTARPNVTLQVPADLSSYENLDTTHTPRPTLIELPPDEDLNPRPRPSVIEPTSSDPDIHVSPDPDVEDIPEFSTLWASRIASTATFVEFEVAVTSYTLTVFEEGINRSSNHNPRQNQPQQRPANRPPRPLPNPNRRRLQFNPIEARRIQTFYQLSKKRAMRTILKENSTYYSGTTDAATEYFQETFSAATTNLDDLLPNLQTHIPPAPDTEIEFMAPFSEDTILKKLSTMSNSAPGKDKVKYRHMKLVDPNATILRLIYNRCLLAQRIPTKWKDATTILIYKKGDSNDPANFRPIALMSCLYKLFSSLIAYRISSYAIDNNLMSPNQKCARPSEGCHEHTFTLQTVVSDAKRNGKNAFIAWLELRNAFGSLPHQAMYTTLQHMGYAPELIASSKTFTLRPPPLSVPLKM